MPIRYAVARHGRRCARAKNVAEKSAATSLARQAIPIRASPLDPVYTTQTISQARVSSSELVGDAAAPCQPPLTGPGVTDHRAASVVASHRQARTHPGLQLQLVGPRRRRIGRAGDLDLAAAAMQQTSRSRSRQRSGPPRTPRPDQQFGHPGLLMQLNSEYEFEPSMFLVVRGRSLRRGNQCWGMVRTVANCHVPQPVVQPEIDSYTSHDWHVRVSSVSPIVASWVIGSTRLRTGRSRHPVGLPRRAGCPTQAGRRPRRAGTFGSPTTTRRRHPR